MESLERNVAYLEFYEVTSAIRSAMKSLKLKTQDGKDHGVLVAKTDCNDQAD